MNFEELLESSINETAELEQGVLDWIEENYDLSDEEDIADLKEDFEFDDDDIEYIKESMVRKVSADRTVTKQKNRQLRKRQATRTTGMSTTKRNLRGRKAARTLKRRPSTQRKAVRKRRRANRHRKAMGL